MKIGRVLILLALILILGLGAAFLWMRRASQAAPSNNANSAAATPVPQKMLSVVVAAQPIRRGTKITDGMLTHVDLPANQVLKVQLTDPKDAIGKLAVRDLAQGMFLTKGDVAEKLSVSAEGSLASLQIPPGAVAISIPMSRLSGVAYGIRPGDHVAVLATFPFVDVDQEFQSILPNHVAVVTPPQAGENGQTLTAGVQDSSAPTGRSLTNDDLSIPFYVIPSEPQRARLVSQMLIKDAVVLYVGTFPLTPQKPTTQQPQPNGENNQQQNQQQQQQQQQQPQQGQEQQAQPQVPPDIVTLVVSPQEAVTLKYLMDRQIVMTLALRAGGDSTKISTDAVTLSYILDAYGVVVPAKLPYDVAPRIDKVVPPKLQNDILAAPPQQ